ncbi:3-beta hydroxysteroid dehydrogenase [Salipaludibacillus keqinensis]|uniref:3-beta hydroxysteroid dehydrogenase n=1 Tax=Salipaludibacillus keqinensis TaxID=2045207 RepID=A0A323TPY0_9BACI|nr:SDR family oxidoreductase [Salipaludibacillus keqinensis]PYZ94623.1 3-beta hydroxysteroid dehydrogenase [Salipaludibacillus keqinensis]
MGNTYFFTGYPGFLAQALITETCSSHHPIDHIYLLILPEMKEKAQRHVASLIDEKKLLRPDQLTLLEGDITKADLGLNPSTLQTLYSVVTHVFHLAAIYDLSVPQSLAEKVNVEGTKHVTDWAKNLKRLERYVYFSTAYVSGKREGKIYEAELEMNQSFKNHYEKTKYDAEVYVRNHRGDLPTTIIRPGIVRGHSLTGATIKFDGPYFILRIFDQFKKSPWIPYLGQGKAEGNFVPVDYVIRASIYLAHLSKGQGKTYHLTDPAPFRMFEVYEMLMKEYLGRRPKGRIPMNLAEKSMAVPQFRKFTSVQREAMSYFTYMSSYDCRQAYRDLEGSGISCPSFDRTLKTMVEYYKEHKDDLDKRVEIR